METKRRINFTHFFSFYAAVKKISGHQLPVQKDIDHLETDAVLTTPTMNMSAGKAKLYEDISGFLYRMGVSLMDHDLKTKDGDCTLDLGCGTCSLTARLASKFGKRGKIVGVEPNEARVQLARKNA